MSIFCLLNQSLHFQLYDGCKIITLIGITAPAPITFVYTQEPIPTTQPLATGTATGGCHIH
jgi:hypothetical protein